MMTGRGRGRSIMSLYVTSPCFPFFMGACYSYVLPHSVYPSTVICVPRLRILLSALKKIPPPIYQRYIRPQLLFRWLHHTEKKALSGLCLNSPTEKAVKMLPHLYYTVDQIQLHGTTYNGTSKTATIQYMLWVIRTTHHYR